MKIRSFFRKNRSFFCLVMGLFAFRWSFADQNLVPSGSMEPAIHVGDHILVNKMAYDLRLPFTEWVLHRTGDPQRGDVVVFMNPQNDMRMVKRLVGLPGDRVVIRDGFVSINGHWLDGDEEGAQKLRDATSDLVFYRERVGERPVSIKRTRSLFREDELDVVVPEGQYFMMGDNRDNSFDSRGWGFVPRSCLRGRAVGVLWNLNLNWNEPVTAEWNRVGVRL